MDKVSHLGELAMIVGVGHDLLEDTDITPSDLWGLGFGDDVIDLLKNVTHLEGEPYMDYIKRAASHPISRAVKMADLEHNSQIFRMKGLRQKDFERLEKYFTAYAYLSE
jgi:(p)ppGpp synthase/HD superfamily hydrolase